MFPRLPAVLTHDPLTWKVRQQDFIYLFIHLFIFLFSGLLPGKQQPPHSSIPPDTSLKNWIQARTKVPSRRRRRHFEVLAQASEHRTAELEPAWEDETCLSLSFPSPPLRPPRTIKGCSAPRQTKRKVKLLE